MIDQNNTKLRKIKIERWASLRWNWIPRKCEFLTLKFEYFSPYLSRFEIENYCCEDKSESLFEDLHEEPLFPKRKTSRFFQIKKKCFEDFYNYLERLQSFFFLSSPKLKYFAEKFHRVQITVDRTEYLHYI